MFTAGFTLIEAVMVIVLTGIVVSVVAVFLVQPLLGYRDLDRRAMLVNAAESALRRMERDIRVALPNSVRISNLAGGGFALELLPSLDGAMYRRRAGGGAGVFNRLNATNLDTDFDIHKYFQQIAVPSSSGTHRLVVDNLGTTGQDNAYTAVSGTPAVITPLGTAVAYNTSGIAGAHHVNLNPAHQFRGHSPRNRVYVVETPVTYLCSPNSANPVVGTLRRYESYPITATQPTDAAVAPLISASTALMADHVGECSATTGTNDVRNRGLVTLVLGIERDGERIRLIDQVHVDNSR